MTTRPITLLHWVIWVMSYNNWIDAWDTFLNICWFGHFYSLAQPSHSAPVIYPKTRTPYQLSTITHPKYPQELILIHLSKVTHPSHLSTLTHFQSRISGQSSLVTLLQSLIPRQKITTRLRKVGTVWTPYFTMSWFRLRRAKEWHNY